MAYGQRGTQEGSSNEIAQGYFHSHITLYCHAMYLTKNSYKFKLNRYNKSWSKKIWMFLYITHHLHLKSAFLCREIFFPVLSTQWSSEDLHFYFFEFTFPRLLFCKTLLTNAENNTTYWNTYTWNIVLSQIKLLKKMDINRKFHPASLRGKLQSFYRNSDCNWNEPGYIWNLERQRKKRSWLEYDQWKSDLWAQPGVIKNCQCIQALNRLIDLSMQVMRAVEPGTE